MSKRIKTMLLAGVGVTHPMTIQALNSGLHGKPDEENPEADESFFRNAKLTVPNEHSR